MTYGNCCGPVTGSVGRRYYTREEKAQWLEEYATELDQELKAVRERIADLRKE